MSQGVAKLKELLFETEARALTDLQRRIEAVARLGTDQRAALSRDLDRVATRDEQFRAEIKQQLEAVFARAGTEERFMTSVAEVLDRALSEAEVAKHDELSEAVAPLVVRTIKREINESQDELVEALYPITGRLVQAYVASAIRDLTDRINKQLAANHTVLRVKSLLTGRSVAELALADSQTLAVDELFLIRRGSGELLARWPDVGGPSDRDQLMSGILTAINEFSLEAFDDDLSSLRQIDLNTSQVYLRASPRLLLAARCSGNANAQVERLIDEEFLTTLEGREKAWDDAEVAAAPAGRRSALLSETAERLDTRLAEIRRRNEEDNSGWLVLKWFGWLLALLLAGWLAWAGYKYATTEWVRERARTVIATTDSLRGYPVRLTVADYGVAVGLDGLAPTAEAKSEIIESLKAALGDGTRVDDELTVVATGPDARPAIAGLKRDLASLETSLQRELQERLEREAFERSTARTLRRLEAIRPDLERLRGLVETPARTDIVLRSGDTVAAVRAELADLAADAATQAEGDRAATLRRIADLRARLAAASASLAGLIDGENAAPATAASADSATNLPAAAEEMAVETERLATLVAALSQALRIKPAPVVVTEPQTPTPRQRLADWIRDHAIFFASATRFRSPESASRHLDELAVLMKDADVTLRIVGFTDEQGGTRQNSPLSQERADLVKQALVGRGVAADRLIAIGRLDAKDISPVLGESSPNRRVEFEIGFVGETDP